MAERLCPIHGVYLMYEGAHDKWSCSMCLAEGKHRFHDPRDPIGDGKKTHIGRYIWHCAPGCPCQAQSASSFTKMGDAHA